MKPHSSEQGLGRVALIGSILGFLLGFHLILSMQLFLHLWNVLHFAELETLLGGIHRIQLLWQWSVYFTAFSTFHQLEFFVTAIYNPSEATADSFLVNHSTAYTAAAITSWTEFWLRLLFVPAWNIPYMSYAGLVLVLLSQCIRSTAMATAGGSFNHVIQNVKKDNHTLIVHGIYSIFRHPSYVGFFYWSIGTQLLLGNALHATLYAIVLWNFFKRRIEYEEDSLCQFFPDDYPAYVARSYMGIPFLSSQVDTSKVMSVKKTS
jgi:protein-S-isoprenylcysteine O-methyltransferase